MRSALVFGGLVLVLVTANASVLDRERLIAAGTPVLLELAPVDPRSLIQGDYMRLDYAITRQLIDSQAAWPRTGQIVVALDGNGVARFVRRHDGRTPVGRDEHLLAYGRKHGRIHVGTDAFHFQEGHAGAYATARYGELRVARSGTNVLIGLRDSARVALIGGMARTIMGR
jgi:uncharacterized membrane-anchored protein